MARPSWSGSIEFAGFNMKVAAWRTTKDKRSESFKTLDPVHKMPVSQQLVDFQGNVVERATTMRGIAVYDGIVPLTPEQLESITEGERTKRIVAEVFPPKDTVDLSLAVGHFQLGPPDAAPEEGASLNVLWNGLRSTERVMVTEITMRGGARPAMYAIEATATGLIAHQMPYASDFQETTSWVPEVNERAAELFELVTQDAVLDDFILDAYDDLYTQRRQTVIDAALRGEKVSINGEQPPAVVAPDLMAELEKQMGDAKPKRKAPAKKTPAKSPRPKRTKVS